MKSEQELVGAARSGDAASMGLLYGRHYTACMSFAVNCTRSKHDAEDVVAEVFSCIWRALRNGAGPTESFSLVRFRCNSPSRSSARG